MSFSRILRKIEQLLLRWMEEPIGVTVPLVAFLAVWLPPQMPDMFAGMETPIWDLQVSARPFLFAFSAMLLGLSAWFWTRAALSARHHHHESDRARILRKRAMREGMLDEEDLRRAHHHGRTKEDEDVAWSEEWAPRLALLFAGGITVLPILFAIGRGHFFSGLLGGELLSFGLVGLLFMFVVYRTEFRWMIAFDAPAWMLRTRATRILADAPFGWPFAVLSLACSFVALVVVGVAPGFISQFDAPTTAIAALAFAVGPLVIALAIMRGLVEQAIYFARWVFHRAEQVHLMPGEQNRMKRVANVVGTILLALWFLSPPWVLEKHVVPLATAQIVEPASGGACAPLGNGEHRSICRPDLRAALQDWIAARRAVSPGTGERLPLVIVAAEGGASRAAVWLLGAMRMLDNRTNGNFGRHVFAISGVSGGSLGAATYARMLRARGKADGALDWEDPDTRRALAHIGTRDLLSGTIATYFLNDMMGSMVGPAWTWAGVPDRNAVLEGTFDQMWDNNRGFALPRHASNGFLGLRFSPQSESRMPVELLPHLLLNGTDVTTGRRLITSTMRWAARDPLFPDAGDFVRMTGRDVRLSTAVTNSARFPFVSPAGRFVNASSGTAHQIIDGGYFENYGARTVWELARAIDDLALSDPAFPVVPIVVVVSNDLDADQAPRHRGGKCRTMLEDAALDGGQVTVRCDDPLPGDSCAETTYASLAPQLRPQDRSIVPQSIAPLLGLAATRSAHGRDALNILKRDFCRAQTAAADDAKVRMIHVALPKPDEVRGEAAPMNWVLNPAACDYMLNRAPWLGFNVRQAERLKDTLDTILGVSLRTTQAERPLPIACK
jgi:hypothetical protein